MTCFKCYGSPCLCPYLTGIDNFNDVAIFDGRTFSKIQTIKGTENRIGVIWSPPQYKNRTYYVFPSGEIYSWRLGFNWKKRIWRKNKSSINYKSQYMSLSRYYVHRIVAECYIPNPENKPCINHKDGNKHNNAVDNLEWVTYSENHKHAYTTGLKQYPEKLRIMLRALHLRRRRLTKEDIHEIHRLKHKEKQSSQRISEQFNVSRRMIGVILNGKGYKDWQPN